MNTNLVKFEASYGLMSQLPQPVGDEIAFVGRSNVGKSSLINKIMGRKSLARVSGVPGKTATINFYRLGDVRFADLPGYGYAKVGKEEKRRFSSLINGYFACDRPLLLTFVLMDIRHEPSQDDKQMVDFLIENELPFVVILTKADKLSTNKIKEMQKVITKSLNCDENLTTIPFSSMTGQGVKEVWDIVDDLLSDDENDEEENEQEEEA